MTKEAFMKELDLILDGATVAFDTKLEDIEEWDSIAVIGLMSVASSNGHKVSATAFNEAQSIEDLHKLVNGEGL